MKQSIKRLLGHGIFLFRFDTVLLNNAAVVVAFHRVQDTAASEELTVSVRAFERYCRFFKRYFHVVSLGDLIDRLERGVTLNRQLAITFDDGYRDNFDNAAPVLERLSLPGTFFVVSQWMGTNIVPWWDRRDGVRHPWMTWDQVRSLHRRGFEIGAHTRSHVDLGQVTGVEALEEIRGARRELEGQLGAPVKSFAYPYGQWRNLTDANRDLVKAAGFRCCCSTVGRVVAPGTDPFHLARVAVSPHFASPQQFGFEVALRRSALPV